MNMYKYVERTFIFFHSGNCSDLLRWWKMKNVCLSYWIVNIGDMLFSFTWQWWKDIVQYTLVFMMEGWKEGEDHTLTAYPKATGRD